MQYFKSGFSRDAGQELDRATARVSLIDRLKTYCQSVVIQTTNTVNSINTKCFFLIKTDH